MKDKIKSILDEFYNVNMFSEHVREDIARKISDALSENKQYENEESILDINQEVELVGDEPNIKEELIVDSEPDIDDLPVIEKPVENKKVNTIENFVENTKSTSSSNEKRTFKNLGKGAKANARRTKRNPKKRVKKAGR
tara:strand:+ start:991 stop:1407 length:417 start_codon:yes stop_codon:yes gene_type:complete